MLQASHGGFSNLILLAGLAYTVDLSCFMAVWVISMGLGMESWFWEA